MNNENTVSTAQAAEYLGVSTRRVVNICREGKFPGAFQNGRSWRIPEDSLKRYLEGTGRKRNEENIFSLRPFAIGNTSYIEISSECYYVDKTLLIRDLIDDHNMVTLFTRPRRFGKTLTMNMIKTFFEKTEVDTSVYFRNQKIWQCGEKYRAMQGRYPVIYFTFKDIKFDCWNDCLEAIRLAVRDELKRHAELRTGASAEEFSDYLKRLEKNTLSTVELSQTMRFLTRLLGEYHHSKVIVLIDEYDTPLQQGYAHGFFQEAVAFMRNFLSAGLKDNSDLAFGVLTGIMRVSKENLFSGLNNPVVNTVLDKKYSEYFGFTEEEVQTMAEYCGHADAMDEVRSWYDGYHFGTTDIYNPWSVTNYFASECRASPYWANTSDNKIIREILSQLTPETAEELRALLQDRKIDVFLDLEAVYPSSSDSKNTIFSFLLFTGYLTVSGIPEETELGTVVSLSLPNAEVRRIYRTEVLNRIRIPQSGNVIAEIESALRRSDGDRLQEALRKYMISSVSYYDTASEGFYHGMMLGLTASLSTDYIIHSNREAGEGRYDVELEPKNDSLPGIVMEFKACDSARKEDLEKRAEEALEQISEKEYCAELQGKGIRDIVKYGIAFSGKNAAVKTDR